MTTFVTGAAGFIGNQLVKALVKEGELVHALIRKGEPVDQLQHERIKIFEGDLLDTASLRSSMADCQRIFHLAAFAQPWAKDPSIYFRVNVEGTVNLLRIAEELEIRRIVYTSSAGTLGPSLGAPVSENTIRLVDFYNEYESSKAMSENWILRYVQRGMEIMMVNPTRVFGPGVLSKSNAITKLIHQYVRKGKTVVPGNGERLGNYVFVEDVIKGHLLAMEHGIPGEKYILGGDNISYNDFFKLVKVVAKKKGRVIKVPIFLILLIARFEGWKARWLKIPPLLTLPWAKRYLADWANSTEFAKERLGYEPTPLKAALEKTVSWIKAQP